MCIYQFFSTGYFRQTKGCIYCRINTADMNLPARFEQSQEELAAVADEMQQTGEPTPSQLAEFDRRVREQINFVFGSDVCSAAFGTTNCMSALEDGRLLFESFLDALIPVIEQDMAIKLEAVRKRSQERMNKYIGQATGEPQ